MNSYKRIFGSGPLLVLAALVLFSIAFIAKLIFHTPRLIIDHFFIRLYVFDILDVISIVFIIWSFTSLNVKTRGKKLITTGAFKYFRHPLYAALITFFDFGLAILLNNWIYVLWAVILHPVGHQLIAGEEKMLKEAFPDDYEAYSRKTGRFFPRFIIKK